MAEGGALRELMVMLGFQIDQGGIRKVERGIEGIKGKLEQLSEIAEGVLAAFAVEKIGEFLVHTAEGAERTALAAEKLGMGVEQFQKLGFAAQQVGLDVGEVAHGFTFLQRAMAGSAEGSAEQSAAFAKLGIDVKDATGKTRDTQEVFGEIADKFKEMEDPTKKAQLAMKIFGRSGADLIPLLNKGGEAIAQFGEEAEALGAIQDDSFFETAEKFMQTFKQIKALLSGLANTAAKPLLEAFGKIMGAVVGWYKANQKLLTLGVANWFKSIADIIEVVAQFFEPLVWIVGEIIKGVAQMNPWVVILTAAGAAMMLAWSPLIATLVLFGLALEDVYTYFQGGKSLTGDLINSLKELWAQFGMKFPHTGFIGFLLDTALPALKNALEDISVLMGALLLDPSSIPGIIKRMATTSHAEMFGDGAASPGNSIAAAQGGTGSRLLDDPNAPAPGAGALVVPTNNITINAQTGASASDIAGHVTAALDDHHDKTWRQTRAALVPAAH